MHIPPSSCICTRRSKGSFVCSCNLHRFRLKHHGEKEKPIGWKPGFNRSLIPDARIAKSPRRCMRCDLNQQSGMHTDGSSITTTRIFLEKSFSRSRFTWTRIGHELREVCVSGATARIGRYPRLQLLARTTRTFIQPRGIINFLKRLHGFPLSRLFSFLPPPSFGRFTHNGRSREIKRVEGSRKTYGMGN